MAVPLDGDIQGCVVPRVNPTAVLSRLRLTAGKAAALCGITRRQLCYWSDKGIIPCCNGGDKSDASRRIYDLSGLRKALMLKQLMDEGRGLRRAVRELRARWVEAPALEEDDTDFSQEHTLLTQAERLTKLGQEARQLDVGGGRREALVRLALALQPLAALANAASEGRVTFAGTSRARQLKSLVAEAERTIKQI